MENSNSKIESVLNSIEGKVGVEVTQRARKLLADKETVKKIIANLSAEDVAAINAVMQSGRGEVNADTLAKIKRIVGE